jgi:hypothetical protein
MRTWLKAKRTVQIKSGFPLPRLRDAVVLRSARRSRLTGPGPDAPKGKV